MDTSTATFLACLMFLDGFLWGWLIFTKVWFYDGGDD